MGAYLLRRLLLVAWIGSHAGTDLARSTSGFPVDLGFGGFGAALFFLAQTIPNQPT